MDNRLGQSPVCYNDLVHALSDSPLKSEFWLCFLQLECSDKPHHPFKCCEGMSYKYNGFFMEEILDFFILTTLSDKWTSSNCCKIKLFRTRPGLQRASIPQARSVPLKDAWSPGGILLPKGLCTVVVVPPKAPSCQERLCCSTWECCKSLDKALVM